MSSNLWTTLLARIKTRVNSHSFNTWFKPTQFVSAGARTLTVRVPNPLFAEWLRNHYMPLILQTLEDIQGETWTVLFVEPGEDALTRSRRTPLDTDPAGEPGPNPATPRASVPPLPGPLDGSAFNPRYTFSTFVEGTGNQFACAAAKAVADQPALSYNPLYIYGGVGLGKTHLMQAIANSLSQSKPHLKLRYLTTETFMNELVTAIRFEKTIPFREKYRSVDVLLVDDIQFLTGKERTQEEFFHTFNTLYDSRKQIVMTSDCPPRAVSGLEERLRSRFEWGLIADIQPPDLETKIAILNKKAEAEGISLPSDVALFIASKIKTNVRELEGLLIRVIAYASITRREIDIELTKETLQRVLPEEPSQVTVDTIQKKVGDHFGLNVSELKSKNNSKSVVFPRQIAMFLCKVLTEQSLPEIGKKFGGKHHTTVLHAIRKIEAQRRDDRKLDDEIAQLQQQLKET
jgi:chromosomal replication initiator protein